MRQERTVQASIFDLFADHEIGRELKAMSQWLDGIASSSGWRRRICADTASRRPGEKACRPSRSCAARFSSSIAS